MIDKNSVIFLTNYASYNTSLICVKTLQMFLFLLVRFVIGSHEGKCTSYAIYIMYLIFRLFKHEMKLACIVFEIDSTPFNWKINNNLFYHTAHKHQGMC